jgi:Arc/MetJ-type ribon-helix-helix transcriptional regulator
MVTGLTPDNEIFLNQTVATGVFPNREAALNEAIRTLRQQMAAEARPPATDQEPAEEWIARVRAWSERHAPIDWKVDDSRDSIY